MQSETHKENDKAVDVRVIKKLISTTSNRSDGHDYHHSSRDGRQMTHVPIYESPIMRVSTLVDRQKSKGNGVKHHMGKCDPRNGPVISDKCVKWPLCIPKKDVVASSEQGQNGYLRQGNQASSIACISGKFYQRRAQVRVISAEVDGEDCKNNSEKYVNSDDDSVDSCWEMDLDISQDDNRCVMFGTDCCW